MGKVIYNQKKQDREFQTYNLIYNTYGKKSMPTNPKQYLSLGHGIIGDFFPLNFYSYYVLFVHLKLFVKKMKSSACFGSTYTENEINHFNNYCLLNNARFCYPSGDTCLVGQPVRGRWDQHTFCNELFRATYRASCCGLILADVGVYTACWPCRMFLDWLPASRLRVSHAT